MTWWAWVLLWAALLMASAVVMFLLARSLWRKTVALFQELGTAADRLAVLDEELTTLAERGGAQEELAVFADPARLRQDRARSRSGTGSGGQPRHRTAAVRPTEPGRAATRRPAHR